MAISHAKSVTIADFTGTVTVFNSAGATTTANATDIVRPSNWNSAHDQYVTLSGNTAGASTLSGSNIVFQGGNNVTLSGNGSTIVFSGPTQTAFVLSNSNGISFGTNASTVTASHNGLTSQSNQAFSAAGGSSAFQTLVFANSNGVSFSNSNGSVVGSVETSYAASNHSHGNPTLALTNLSGTTASASNGLTLSLSAAAPGAVTLTNYATGNTTQSSSGTIAGSSVIFRGSGGVSAGVSNGSVVVEGPALTSLSVTGALSASSNGSTISLGVGTVTLSATSNTTQASSGTVNLNALVLHGAGGASVGISNGSIVISGATGGGGANAVNLLGANTAGNTTATGSTIGWSGLNLTLSGTNGSQVVISAPATSSLSATGAVSLSTNGSTISIGVGTVTVSATSNTTQASSGTVNLNALVLNGMGVASVGISNGSILVSVPSGGGAGDGYNILAAGTQTATTAGSVLFENSNGITFGMSGSTRITASHNGLTTAALSDHSHGFSAAGGSSAFQTLSFSNANGATFTNTNGQVGLSYSVPVVSNAIQPVGSATGSGTNVSRFAADDHVHEGVFSVGVSTGGNTAGDTRVGPGRFVLAGGNNITLSQATAAGGLNTISIVAGAGGGGVALSAGTQSVSTGTVAFSNSNGITFGMSGSNQITASYNSTQFAGTGTTFAGANISASMTLNSNGLNLSASVAAPGAAAENNAHNLLGANTAGNTTATGSTIGLSGVNITLSGTNASQIVISAPATSSLVGASGLSVSTNGSTISVLPAPIGNLELFELGNNSAFSTLGQNSIYLQQFFAAQHVTFNNIERRFSGSSVSSTNSQVAAHTYDYGLYSRGTGASTSIYSQIATSQMYFAASYNSNTQAGWTVSQGAGSVTSTSAGTVLMSAITGLKHLYFPFAGTVTQGRQYAIAMRMSSATTVGTSPLRIGLLELTNINNLTIGQIDTAAGFSISNASRIGDFGQGVYSATSSNLPSTIAVSGLTNAVSLARMYVQLD